MALAHVLMGIDGRISLTVERTSHRRRFRRFGMPNKINRIVGWTTPLHNRHTQAMKDSGLPAGL